MEKNGKGIREGNTQTEETSKEKIDEGILDFLKGIWRSIFGVKNKFENADPILKEKYFRTYLKAKRLYDHAKQLGIYDSELSSFIHKADRKEIDALAFSKMYSYGYFTRIFQRVSRKVNLAMRGRI